MNQIDLTEFNRGQGRLKGLLVYLSMFIICTLPLRGQGFETEQNQVVVDEAELIGYGQTFAEMLNAENDESAKTLARKVLGSGSADDWAISLRKEYGKVEVGRIRTTIGSEYQTTHVIVKILKTGAWRNFQLVFDNEIPKRSKRINIVLAARPIEVPEGQITDTNVLKVLSDYVDELAMESGLSGSLLIARGNEIMIEKTYGLADRDAKRDMDGKTPISLASGGKMFTATAILKLMQTGKLELSDPLIKFLPNYPDKAFARRATVADLLSHTSGLGDYWDAEYEKQASQIKSLEDYLPHVTRQPLRFESTGTGSYSNSGFILLGLIIEKVTGEVYADHVRRTIFEEYDMKNTGFFTKEQRDRVAIGYFEVSKELSLEAPGQLGGSSAGGVLSTALDMLKFRNALIEHKLLNKETYELATSLQSRLDGGGMGYGYGFTISETFNRGFGHGGQWPGGTFSYSIDKDSGLTLILLSNNNNGAAAELMFTIKEVLSR